MQRLARETISVACTVQLTAGLPGTGKRLSQRKTTGVIPSSSIRRRRELSSPPSLNREPAAESGEPPMAARIGNTSRLDYPTRPALDAQLWPLAFQILRCFSRSQKMRRVVAKICCSAFFVAPMVVTPGSRYSGNHFAEEGQISYGNSIVIHPTDPNSVICGGVDLHRTKNGGTTWRQITHWDAERGDPGYAHADHHALLMPAAVPGSHL